MAAEKQISANRMDVEANKTRPHAQLIETEGAPGQIGFVSAIGEIISPFYFVACPAMLDRPGFQWRGPLSRPGSRQKKKKRAARPQYN